MSVRNILLIGLATLVCLVIAFQMWPTGDARAEPDNVVTRNTNTDQVTASAETRQRYDQVTWLCTHNAYNASDAGFRMANQTHTIKVQLENGVEALMLDFWPQDDGIVLRHGDTLGGWLGEQPLKTQLVVIRNWLERNPDSIITLIIESYVDAATVAAEFETTGLDSFCHVQAPTEPWPTLHAMRKSNQRLVVFTDKPAGGPNWYLPVWDHCYETHWKSANPEQLLANRPGRGQPENSLLIVNHFLTTPLQQFQSAKTVNAKVFLDQRFGPTTQLSRLPNFVVVDFYELGDWSWRTGKKRNDSADP